VNNQIQLAQEWQSFCYALSSFLRCFLDEIDLQRQVREAVAEDELSLKLMDSVDAPWRGCN
jgi:hypothetical protein